MAETARPSLNGTGHGSHYVEGMPTLEREHIRGRQSADFDLNRSRLSMSPALFWSILTGSVTTAAVITFIVWQTNSRIGNVENGINDLRDEIKTDRQTIQTRQQAYIDCLETERRNRGFSCPLAREARVPAPAPPPVPARKVPRTKEQPSPSPFSWLSGLTN